MAHANPVYALDQYQSRNPNLRQSPIYDSGKFASRRNRPWMTNALGIKSGVALADKARFTPKPRRHGKHVMEMPEKGYGPRYLGAGVWSDLSHKTTESNVVKPRIVVVPPAR